MKKLLLSLAALLVVGIPVVSAQTPAEVLQSHNNGVCLEAGLSVGCTDAEALTAHCAGRVPCVDDRGADSKVYSTSTSFRDAVILPRRYAEVFAQKRGKVIERLNQLILDPARCAVILAAAGLDVSVCK